MAQTNPTNQENGLLPTSTSASPSQLNFEDANQKGGQSFIDGQSGLIHGETQNSAGGDFDAPNGSNSTYNHQVPVKHGKEAVILAPDILSLQGTQNVLSVASAQQDARIGYTGPIVNSNSVGNENIANSYNVPVVQVTVPGTNLAEVHTNLSVPNYLIFTLSGSTLLESESITSVPAYTRSTISGNSITESDTIAGLNYNTTNGVTTISLANPALVISNVQSVNNLLSGTAYPSSAIGTSGAGWYQSGTSLGFTNGAFPSFSGAATAGIIPASGVPFYVGYSYNSTFYINYSGAVSVPLNNSAVTILNVYSGNATASGTYSPSSLGVNGAGWYQSGTSLIFTNGKYANFIDAANAKQVPASGASFFTNYSYNSTNYNTFSGSLVVALNNANISTVFNIYSGNSLASGTYSTTASGVTGAGWSQAGQTVVFTNGGYMNFGAAASALQIPVSGVPYYVDYNYNTTSGTALGQTSFTGRSNDLNPLYIPNIGGRFAR